jgi:hypothetical protein
MAAADCMGQGSGWGTIAGVRLRILILAPRDRADAQGLARVLIKHHDALLAEESGVLAALSAARAARTHNADLVHSVGVEGAARSAETVALGVGAPLVQSLSGADLDARSAKRALDRAARATAVIADSGATADRLRSAGIARDIYVVASPNTAARDDDAIAEALDVIYGRIIADARPDLVAPKEAPRDIVTIGGLKPKAER